MCWIQIFKEYVHKAVGVCGVSAGPFGGARMIQSLVPVLRELGLVTISMYFSTAGKLFDPVTGKITDPAYTGRVKKFLDQLVWMSRALRFCTNSLRIIGSTIKSRISFVIGSGARSKRVVRSVSFNTSAAFGRRSSS